MTSKNDASSPTKDTHQEATAASLSEKAQQIVSDLNSKRKQDTEILTELKTTLLSHVMLSKKLVHNTNCLMSVLSIAHISLYWYTCRTRSKATEYSAAGTIKIRKMSPLL